MNLSGFYPIDIKTVSKCAQQQLIFNNLNIIIIIIIIITIVIIIIIIIIIVNAKVGRKNIFHPRKGTESVHPESNDNGIRLVNFVTSKNLIEKSTNFHIVIFTIIRGHRQMVSHTIR